MSGVHYELVVWPVEFGDAEPSDVLRMTLRENKQVWDWYKTLTQNGMVCQVTQVEGDKNADDATAAAAEDKSGSP